MKQIFEILQEERDRILGIHESATKNQYLNTLIVEKENLTKSRNYGNGIINRGGNLVGDKNYFTVRNITVAENPRGGSGLKFFKGTKFVGGSEGYLKTANPVTVQFPDAFANTGTSTKGTIFFNCNSKLLIVKDISDAGKSELFGYETSKNTYDLSADSSGLLTLGGLRAVCDNIKEGVKGSSNLKQTPDGNVVGGTDKGVDNTNYEVGSDRNLIASNGKTVFKILKGTRFKIYPEKNGASGKAKFIGGDQSSQNVWFNCNSGKFLIKNVLPVVDPTTNTTIPAGQKTFSYTSDQPFVDFFKKKCENAKSGGKKDDKSNVDNANLSPGNVGRSTVVKPTDTALDTILQKISGAATQKPGEVKQAPQTWEG
jgi:hypothetical protein